MATFDVFNLKREKVGSIDLADEVFGAEVQGAPLLRGREGAARVASAQGTAGRQEPLRGQRQHEEALQAEGHRPRASRLDPRAASTSAAARPTRRARATGATARRARCASARSRARSRSKFAKEGRLIVVDSFELAEIKTKALARGARRRSRPSKKTLVVDVAGQREAPPLDPQLRGPPVPAARGRQRLRPAPPRHLVLSKDAAKALEARCLGSAAPAQTAEEKPCSPSRSSAGRSSSPRRRPGSARSRTRSSSRSRATRTRSRSRTPSRRSSR